VRFAALVVAVGFELHVPRAIRERLGSLAAQGNMARLTAELRAACRRHRAQFNADHDIEQPGDEDRKQ
jgi:hypothetical protein